MLNDLRKSLYRGVLCICIMHQYIDMLAAAGGRVFDQFIHRHIIPAGICGITVPVKILVAFFLHFFRKDGHQPFRILRADCIAGTSRESDNIGFLSRDLLHQV